MLTKEDFIYLYNNKNQTGKFSKESHIKKHHYNIYLDIINIKENILFKEKVYWYVYDIKIHPICKECGKQTKFIGAKIGYRIFCSCRCSTINEETIKKYKNTNLYRHGFDCILKNKEYMKECIVKKYNVEYYSQTDDFKEKFKETSLKNYNTDNPAKNEDVKNKIKNTCLEKYEVTTPLKNKKIKEKQIETTKKLYNSDSYSKTEIYRNKFRLKFIEKFKDKLNILNISDDNICEAICDCGENHTFKISKNLIYSRIKSNLKCCTICNSTYYTSGGQLEIYDLIKNHYINSTLSDRNIIKGEIDVFIPDIRIAFEYNGLWWHNEKNKPKTYHFDKTILCENKSISLYHIWEDEWNMNKNIVKSNILNILDNNFYHITNSNIIIKKINDINIIKKFISNNSFENYKKTKYNIGLYENENLISLITLSKNNKNFIVNNFVNKIFYKINNNFKIMFEYFIKLYNPENIYIKISKSCYYKNILLNNNFIITKQHKPKTWFIENNKRVINNINKNSYKLYDDGYLTLTYKQHIS